MRQPKQIKATEFLSSALLGVGFICFQSTVYCAGPKDAPLAMRLLVESDNGRTLDIRLGESVRISLLENATSGYRWAIDRYDEQIIEALSTEARYPANSIGVGGEVAFIFKGKKV